MPIRGSNLRAERAKARVTSTALAARLGVSRATLWNLELRESVEPDRAREYRSALQAIRDAKQAAAEGEATA